MISSRAVQPTNIVLLLFILMDQKSVISETVVVPTNTAVIAGDEMNMNCLITNHSNNSTVRKWSFYNSVLAIPTIYDKQGSSGRFHEHFRHFGVRINANGPVTIFTNSTRSSDAGNYTCHCEIDGKDVEYSAHLIVLESRPVCESNLIGGDTIWFQCSINFRGFWAPSMEWIQYGGDTGPEGKRVTDGIETTLNSSQSITSKLIITIDSLPTGCYYLCKIYFANNSSTQVTTANNIPNFSYTWNSSEITYTSQSVFTVTSSTTETSSSVNWSPAFLSIVAGVVLLFILLIALAIARFIRLRKTVSENATITPGSLVPAGHGAQNSRPPKYFGDDGTEYMEVNAIGRKPMPATRPVHPNMFNVVGEYAFIDHTLSPPIPPRGKNA